MKFDEIRCSALQGYKFDSERGVQCLAVPCGALQGLAGLVSFVLKPVSS